MAHGRPTIKQTDRRGGEKEGLGRGGGKVRCIRRRRTVGGRASEGWTRVCVCEKEFVVVFGRVGVVGGDWSGAR